MKKNLVLGLLIVLSFFASAQITLDSKPYGPKPVVSGLEVPWGMEWLGNDSIIFSQIDGKVYVADVVTGNVGVALELNVARENQAGLLDIKLSSDFSSSRTIYLSYCYYQSQQLRMRLSAFQYHASKLDSERVLIDNIGIVNANIGGRIEAVDDKVFFTVGDRREANNAQNTNNYQGKILRINSDGSTPFDNPFSGSLVWSYGHRNPQGLCAIDSLLFSSEHGPSNNDELNLITKAGNYGWPQVTGKCPPNMSDTCLAKGFVDPVQVWDPPVAPCGIAYYPESGSIQEWQNSMLVGNLRGQGLTQVKLSTDKKSSVSEKVYMDALLGRIREVLVSPSGRVFVSSSNEDAYGTSRPGGDQIFEITEGYTYLPPDMNTDTSFDEVIRLNETVLQTRVIAKNLEIPWDLDMDHTGLFWFSERNGNIKTLDPETGEQRLVYQIGEVYQSIDNSGLHAMALHPKFPLVPYIYVNYTYHLYGARFVRYTYSVPSRTFTDSIHLIHHIPANITHNGSRVVFENDSILYLSLGDGFTGIEPQQYTSNNGKILRMTTDGRVPKDNPFDNSFAWSIGHRNPQGLTFGKNGLLYSSEHGVATDDELNLIEKGRNYGWPRVEGYCDFVSEQEFCDSAKVREPLLTWTPTEAPCGLAYFDHPSIPEWSGSLLQTFLKNKELTVIELTEDGRAVTRQEDHLDRLNTEGKKIGIYGRLRDVFVAPNGKIYLATSNREENGKFVVKEDDDKIIEIYNPDFDYESNERELISSQSEVFPNPVRSHFYVKTETQGQRIISLFNSTGQVLNQKEYNTEQGDSYIYIERAGLSPGIYYLKINFEGKTEIIKLVFL